MVVPCVLGNGALLPARSKLLPGLYSPIMAKAYQPNLGITSVFLQIDVENHPAGLEVIFVSMSGPPNHY